jgi:hypothetical protein
MGWSAAIGGTVTQLGLHLLRQIDRAARAEVVEMAV